MGTQFWVYDLLYQFEWLTANWLVNKAFEMDTFSVPLSLVSRSNDTYETTRKTKL